MAKAPRKLSTAPSFCATKAPPWKIGAVTPDASCHISLVTVDMPLVMKVSNPSEAESVMEGYIWAVATPMAALAACRLASDARMSGRWCTRSEGRLTGSSPGSASRSRSNSGADHSAGNLPSRIASASFAVLSCWRNGGSSTRSFISCDSAVSTSVCAALPPSYLARTRSRFFSSSAMISSVAAISRRVPAMLIACDTTLPVSMR